MISKYSDVICTNLCVNHNNFNTYACVYGNTTHIDSKLSNINSNINININNSIEITRNIILIQMSGSGKTTLINTNT